MEILEYITQRRVVCRCDGCGSKVTKNLSQVNENGPIFCSPICRNKNYKTARPEWTPKTSSYIAKCQQCGAEYIMPGKFLPNKKRFCSKACVNQYKSSLPRIGHTEATRARLAEKQREYCQTHGNQFSIGKSKGKHTKDTINKMSASNIGRPPKWRGRTFIYDGPMGHFKMRSSYELFYANYLDSQGVQWQYEPQFKLSNGKMFAPDFKLDGGCIIEVKGFWAVVGKEKWELFCKDYPDIPKKVLMKEDLELLGMKG